VRDPDRPADDEVPEPAHPLRRQLRLPEATPKSAEGDGATARRVAEIMDSPGYRLPERDVEFLERDNLRGTRLQIDYEKPENALREAGVRNTIVVFGGTRIVEPEEARQRVSMLEAACRDEPGDDDLAARLAVSRRLLEHSRYYDVAREFGAIVARAGEGPDDCRLTLITGGGPGIMEAANRGATEAGANSIGINIEVPFTQYPNPWVTPGLGFRVHYFSTRKLHLLLRARALVVFPGGFGTLDELFETLNLVQTRKIRPLPVVLVGRGFWKNLVDFDGLVAEGVIDPEDRRLFWFAETAEQVWQGIVDWHARAGLPLVRDDEPGAGGPPAA